MHATTYPLPDTHHDEDLDVGKGEDLVDIAQAPGADAIGVGVGNPGVEVGDNLGLRLAGGVGAYAINDGLSQRLAREEEEEERR